MLWFIQRFGRKKDENREDLYLRNVLVYHFVHSHKKQKDSLETRAVLLKLWLEFEISGVAVQKINQNSEKWWLL